jgi:hypothetical protein
LEVQLKNIILRRVSIFEFLHSQGQSRRFDRVPPTSALPPSTDIVRSARQVRFVPTGDIVRPQTETLKAKKPRTMPGRMMLFALNDHNEAVYLSKLDR